MLRRLNSSTSTRGKRSCSLRFVTRILRCQNDNCRASLSLSDEQRSALLTAAIGDRQNRRHKPGRSFERLDYRFDVLSDCGGFRDLQRHRLMTIDWQRLTPNNGFVRPELVEESESGTSSMNQWSGLLPSMTC